MNNIKLTHEDVKEYLGTASCTEREFTFFCAGANCLLRKQLDEQGKDALESLKEEECDHKWMPDLPGREICNKCNSVRFISTNKRKELK